MNKDIPTESMFSIRKRLGRLYPDQADALVERFRQLIGRYGIGVESYCQTSRWSEKDAYLITYADMVKQEGEAPLKTLKRFSEQRLKGAISTIHILPFYPWSSDDGFSVKDYREVQSDYGDWTDVKALGVQFKLMFDLVLNHCSRQGAWFGDYVKGIDPYRHYFIEMDPETDLSAVTRPRPSSVLSPVTTIEGKRHVWTTFSADQVDLNWKNPDVLFDFLDILFLYLSYGATVLRMDAVAFVWKEVGTTCLHLPETHEIVKLLRDILDIVAPQVVLLTETNVPHNENISYFGDGDEAHMVYQFSLPPLVLHGLLNGTTEYLTPWAASLEPLASGCTYLNFTASHDGVGVRPLQGLVPPEELDALIDSVREREGEVGWRDNGDGTQSPYELNITYFSALSEPGNPELGRLRFICSQAVAMGLQGVPAFYFHSLCGCVNWMEGVRQTNHKRTINRLKWNVNELDAILDDPDTEGSKVFRELMRLLGLRNDHRAFHPDAPQEILNVSKGVFAFVRKSLDGSEVITCLYNFQASVDELRAGRVNLVAGVTYHELIGGSKLSVGVADPIQLSPYQALWLLEKQA